MVNVVVGLNVSNDKNQYIFLVETTYNSSNQDENKNYTTATTSTK